MTEIFEDIIKNIDTLVKKVSTKSEKYVKKVISSGNKLSQKGINQLEIEKLKWELKKIKKELGNYVYMQSQEEKVSDFSNDTKFDDLVDQVHKLDSYIKKITQK